MQLRMKSNHVIVYEETDLSDAEADQKALDMMSRIQNSGLYVVVLTTNDYLKPADDILTSNDAR